MTAHPEVFSILVVCTANICRSPLTEHLLRAELGGGPPGMTFDVQSAGTLGWNESAMDPVAAAELRRLGGDPTEFRARSFTSRLGEDTDLILTAAVEHRAYVLREVPRALRRTFTLLEFAHLVSAVPRVRDAAGSPHELVRRAAAARGAASIDEYDIADPYGASADVHRQTATAIHSAARAVAAGLAANER